MLATQRWCRERTESKTLISSNEKKKQAPSFEEKKRGQKPCSNHAVTGVAFVFEKQSGGLPLEVGTLDVAAVHPTLYHPVKCSPLTHVQQLCSEAGDDEGGHGMGAKEMSYSLLCLFDIRQE